MKKSKIIIDEQYRNCYRKKGRTLTAVLIACVAASHWSVCFMKRVIVAAKARISSSMHFSLTKQSWTPPFTASTNRSDTRAAFLIASFFFFSVEFHQNLKNLIDFERKTKRNFGPEKGDFGDSPVSSRSLRDDWWWSWTNWRREDSNPPGSASEEGVTRARATGRGVGEYISQRIWFCVPTVLPQARTSFSGGVLSFLAHLLFHPWTSHSLATCL